MRTSKTKKLFSYIAIAFMMVTNINPMIATAEEQPVSFTGLEEAHIEEGEVNLLEGVAATKTVDGAELQVTVENVEAENDEEFTFQGETSLVAKHGATYTVTYGAKDESNELLATGFKSFIVDTQEEGNVQPTEHPASSNTVEEESTEEQPQETPGVMGAKRGPILGVPNPSTGVDIQAYIIDDSGNQIDFSQGTSGTVAKLSEVVCGSGQNRQHVQTQYSVSITVSGLGLRLALGLWLMLGLGLGLGLGLWLMLGLGLGLGLEIGRAHV